MNPIIAGVGCWSIFLISNITREKKLVLKVRSTELLGLGFLFIVSIFIVYNTDNADYKLYQDIYLAEGNNFFTSNILFQLLCKLGNILQLDYQTFRCFLLYFGLFSMFNFVRKYSDNVLFIIILYTLSSAIMDGIQFRQFTAMGIYLFVLPLLLKENSKKSVVVYIVGTIIASLIHISFIFFLLFLFIKVDRKKRIIVASVITIFALASFIIMSKTNLLITLVSQILTEDKVNLYFIDTKYHSSYLQVIQFIFTQQVFMLTLLYVYTKIGKVRIKDKNFIWSVISINILMLCLSPIFFYSLQFRRVFRIIMIPSYIALAKMLPSVKNVRYYGMMVLMISFGCVSLWLNLNSNPDLITNLICNNYFW